LPTIAFNTDREFRVINAANDLADNSAQIIACTRTGRMIISTLGNINFYDGSSFTHIDTRQEYQYPLPLYSGNDHLYFDRFHHMWLKFSGNMTCVDLMHEQFVTNIDSLLKTEFLLEQGISDLFVGRDGYPFFQVNDVLYSVKTKQNYQLIAYRDLQDVEVIDDRLYTFYDNGVEVAIDMKTGKIVHQTKAFANNDDASLFNKSSLLIDYLKGAAPVADVLRLGMPQVQPADLVQQLTLAPCRGKRRRVAGVHGVVLRAHGQERADVREHEYRERNKHHN
jgi:hypothetical protein